MPRFLVRLPQKIVSAQSAEVATNAVIADILARRKHVDVTDVQTGHNFSVAVDIDQVVVVKHKPVAAPVPAPKKEA